MDLDLFRQVVEQVAPLSELICFHLMGDPLVHPQLEQMIDICDQYQANIFLVTNGVLLRPESSQTPNAEMLEQICQRFDFTAPTKIDVRRQKSINIKNRLYLHFDTEFIWPSLDLPILGTRGTCYGLSSHFGVLADGTVVPCCLDKEAAISLGHISEAPILEILSSRKAQDIIKGFKQRQLVEDLCQRCQYIERFDNT